MKYIKRLNIDFDNWVDIPMSTNEQQIKELHPIFYQFLKEKNLLEMYLKLFNKCHWKDKGNTFEEVMNYYKSKRIFLLNPIDRTLNYQCVNIYNIKYFNIIVGLDSNFKQFLKKYNLRYEIY
jgi:hypothetical protein